MPGPCVLDSRWRHNTAPARPNQVLKPREPCGARRSRQRILVRSRQQIWPRPGQCPSWTRPTSRQCRPSTQHSSREPRLLCSPRRPLGIWPVSTASYLPYLALRAAVMAVARPASADATATTASMSVDGTGPRGPGQGDDTVWRCALGAERGGRSVASKSVCDRAQALLGALLVAAGRHRLSSEPAVPPPDHSLAPARLRVGPNQTLLSSWPKHRRRTSVRGRPGSVFRSRWRASCNHERRDQGQLPAGRLPVQASHDQVSVGCARPRAPQRRARGHATA